MPSTYVADWYSETGHRLVVVEPGRVNAKLVEVGSARAHNVKLASEGRYLTPLDKPTVERACRRIKAKRRLLRKLAKSGAADQGGA